MSYIRWLTIEIVSNKPRIIPEWQDQQATLITWPHAQSDWRDQLPRLDEFYTQWVKTMAEFQPVIILCFDKPHETHVQQCLQHDDNIKTLLAPTNDTWIRDYGPIFLTQEHNWVLLDFQFNAWGGKFPYQLDNDINTLLHQQLFSDSTYQSQDMILEGGSIEFDGQGTMLTTSRCLLNSNRTRLSKHEMESRLKRLFNLQQILWLDHGNIQGDDTDGHIDTLVRFCNEHTLCYMQCQDSKNLHYRELKAMEKQLRDFRSVDGQSYHLVPLPLPSQVDLGPATYANFIYLNGAIVFPKYGLKEDQIAHDIFQQLFPERQIIGIDCRPLIQQGGALHCASMQIPLGLKH